MADTELEMAPRVVVSPWFSRVAVAAVHAFLVVLFLNGIEGSAILSLVGFLVIHVYTVLVLKYWEGLERSAAGDMLIIVLSAEYILLAALFWDSFSSHVWECFFGMAIVQAVGFLVVRYWKELRQAPSSAWFGLIVILIYVLVATLAPIIAPFTEFAVVGDQFQLWGSECQKVEHCPDGGGELILGTDNLGRDMMTRIIYGARNTIGIAFVTTILAFTLGGLMGLLAASLGGWIDQLSSRVVDVLMAIPSLIFSLLILTVVGTSTLSIIMVIGILDSTRVYRLARAVAMNIVVMDYVEVAKLRGEGLMYIIKNEVLPNALPPLVAEFGLRFCFVFLFISALSFLGLGLQPPTADWGSMVKDNATLITFGDITPLVPAAAIALLTVGVNFVVDWFLHKTSGLKS